MLLSYCWKLVLLLHVSFTHRHMPDLHSRRRHSLRLSARCERDEVRTNVDIHTLVQELWDKIECSLNNKERHSCPLTRARFTNMFLWASRRDENSLRIWQTRRMYPSHSDSHLMLFRRECKPGYRCCVVARVHKAGSTRCVVCILHALCVMIRASYVWKNASNLSGCVIRSFVTSGSPIWR